MKIMYHCTRYEFLPEILRHGLKPTKHLPEKTINKKVYMPPHKQPSAVFVSETQFKWMHWAQSLPNGKYVAGAIIKLNVEGLDMIPDPFKEHEGDWAVLETINPDRILEVSVSTDENPCSFKKLIKD